MSGRRSSSGAPSRSGSTGPSGTRGRAWRAALRFAVRATLLYAAVYLLWTPLRGPFLGGLAGVAERLLFLVVRPPALTSLEVRGGSILLGSYLADPGQPLASWNTWNLHIYAIATLALALAAGIAGWRRRLALFLWAALAVGSVSLAVVVVQGLAVAREHASSVLHVTLFTAAENQVIDLLSRSLVEVGMLLVPAFIAVAGLAHGLVAHPQEATPGAERRALAAPVVTGALLAVILVIACLVARSPDQVAVHAGWEKILALNPGYVPALQNVATHRQDEGRPEEALVLLKRAVALEPAQPVARYNLANALLRHGDAMGAVRQYEESLRLSPDDAGTHHNLAIALLQRGEECQALRHLERAAEIRPGLRADAKVWHQVELLRRVCTEPAR